MTTIKDLYAKAEQFAARAAASKQRTSRNTYRSLEQSCRTLAANQELSRAAGAPEPVASDPSEPQLKQRTVGC